MAAITVPARASPVPKETADSVASRITSGLRMIFKRRTGQPCRRSCATSFGPVVRALVSASACVRPRGAVPKPRSNSSPSFRAASRTAGETRIFWCFAFVCSSRCVGGPVRPEATVPLALTEASAVLPASGLIIVPLTALRSLLLQCASVVAAWILRTPERMNGLQPNVSPRSNRKLRGFSCRVMLSPNWIR